MLIKGTISVVNPPDYADNYGNQYQNITVDTIQGQITGRIGCKKSYTNADIGQQGQWDTEQATSPQGPYNKFKKHYDTPEMHHHRTLDGLDVQGYDLVVGYPILASEWALASARKAGIPCWNWVLDCESLCKKYAPAVGNRMHFGTRHTAALRNSDKLLSISEYAVPFIKEWTGNENTIGLMGCVNSRAADSVWTEGRTRFVAISRLTEHKRFQDLCYVAKRVNVKIDLITSFGMRAVESRLAANSVQARVTVWDSPDDKTKFKLLKLAQALLCPSAYEGLGMPMMEALYCGVPVICYDYGVMREVCEDAALYAAWSSPESFMKQVEAFLKDDYKRLDLEMAARRVGKRYSFEAMCKRLKEVFGVGDLWDMTKRKLMKKWSI